MLSYSVIFIKKINLLLLQFINLCFWQEVVSTYRKSSTNFLSKKFICEIKRLGSTQKQLPQQNKKAVLTTDESHYYCKLVETITPLTVQCHLQSIV